MLFKSFSTKGLTALFLFLLSSAALATPEPLKLLLNNKSYDAPLWHSLLHYNGKPNLIADGFLLTKDNFSPKNELVATYNYLLQHKGCRYIARQLFINQELTSLGLATIPIDKTCTDYHHYRTNVPAEKLELVYASEDLMSPTSMLGHIFLKASGYNDNKQYVEHTLSFFNEINTSNPIKLFSDALVTGMPGYFVIRPFYESVNRYVSDENRNLLLYGLIADTAKAEILMAHLWELKHIEISYLFQSYNCATMTLFLLSILNEQTLDNKGLWVTPLDVLKASQQANLISSQTGLFSAQYIDKIKPQIKQKKLSAITYKPPQDRPSDSLIRLKLQSAMRQEALHLALAPVSKELLHDSSAFIDDSALIMGEIELGYQIDNDELYLNQLKLYEMSQFIDGEHFLFATGYRANKSATSSANNHWYLQVAKGFYQEFSGTAKTYIDLVGGVNLATTQSNAEIGINAGLLLTTELSKLQTEISLLQNTYSKLNKRVTIKANYFLPEEMNFELSSNYIDNGIYQDTSISLALSKLF